MTIYFLSGLGADKRVFQKLSLPDTYSIVHIEWIAPKQDEPLEEYVKRLSTVINQNDSFCIVGLSFGGIVASELSKIVKPKKTIILSSITTHKQLPLHFSILKHLHLHKIIPARFLKLRSPFIYWFMGVQTDEEKILFNQILEDTDIDFFRWAIATILHWKHEFPVSDLYHIHGTTDRIFPIKELSPSYKINNGGHLMVYSKAPEISAALTAILNR